MDEKTLKENLQVQLDELETLEAMFYNPGEIKIEDPLTLLEIKEYVDGNSVDVPLCLDYAINLVIDGAKFELCVSLSHEYPYIEPELFVRNNQLNRDQHISLNKKIGEFVSDLPKGEPCIFTTISWLQDNASEYVELDSDETTSHTNDKDEELVRYWIYSHHIYSKTKRKAIIDLANQMKITGFVMPGKPGIICVEGVSSDVVEWWQSIKSMNWKKIFCKTTESNKEELKAQNFIKFHGFIEKVFDNHGPKYNHMDMGEFYKYLEEHELGYIFKDIFGVEAKTT
ncbi:RWD domain-containing protein 2A [Sitophilus oryzae]|uniref:RWD domain-containing protein 2A n=1 Tax=Sitophilus oryzae TaxID=7048 RepID=A0A6J2YT60_SITOR|nr:RWD domain-containing protein 2A [Sitophilus oryzae]